MPAEIRNSMLPTSVVDLLLPAPGASTRGESADGFDSLLRALAPVERPASSQTGGSSSQSENSYRATNSYDSPTSNYAPRPSDAPQGRNDRPQQSEHSQPNNKPARENDAPASESQRQPQQSDVAGAENPIPRDEAPVQVVDCEQHSELDEPVDEELTATVIDATAQQLAAAAAQAATTVVDTQPKTTEPTEGEVVAELEPAVETPGHDADLETFPTTETSPATTATLELPTPEGAATEIVPSQQQVEQPEVEVAAPTAEVPESVSAEPPAAETEQPQDEQPILSDLRSTRTQTDGSIRHAAPASQSGDAAEPTPNEGETKLQAESADPASQVEIEARAVQTETATDSDSRRDRDHATKSQPLNTEPAEPVNKATFEATAVEPTSSSEPAQAEPAPAATAEPTRTEPTSHQPQQSPQHLVDGNVRTGGAPRLAAEVLAANPREANPPRPVEIDSARFLTRVARAFTAAQQRGGEVQMRLSPPELGSLRVEIKVVEGVMTARVETENASAQSALLEHLPQLRERLAEQGVRIERFDVDLMQNGGSNTPDRPTDHHGDEGSSRRGAPPINRARSAAAPDSRTEPAALSTSGGLNVIV